MEGVAFWVASVAAMLSLMMALVVTLAWGASTRRANAEIAELKARIDGLDTESRYTASSHARPPADSKERGSAAPLVAEFLITDAGVTHQEQPIPVSSRLVFSATAGEPLVKVVSFVYGVRRALTPENRNRIRFEMRRELRRARKTRRAAGRAAAAESRSQAVDS